MKRTAFSAFMLGLLMACGGGSSSSSPNFEGLSAPEILDRVDDLNTTTADLEITDSGAIGTSGSATYSGAIGVFLNRASAEGGVGEFVMTVNLENGAVSGTAGNFYSLSETVAEGSLELQNGRFVRATLPTITGELTGTVDFERGPEVFDLDLLGFFRGASGNYAVGVIEGTGRLTNGDTRPVDGAFWAEQ